MFMLWPIGFLEKKKQAICVLQEYDTFLNTFEWIQRLHIL
jgi:hypothetical protein